MELPAKDAAEFLAGGGLVNELRRLISKSSTFCLMVATTLHSIAVGNLLPARVIADPEVRAGPGMSLTPDPNDLGLGDYVALLPLSPLLHGESYTARLEFAANGVQRTRQWSFTVTGNRSL